MACVPIETRSSRAFTLVEMTMCMVIMLLFAAIAAPRYANSIARYRADMAAKRLAADVNWARALARTGSTSRSITFNTGTSTYTLTGVSNPDSPSSTYSVNLSLSPYKSTITSASFGATSTLTFDGFGTPSNAGTVVITCGATSKTVSVNADDGAVSVQ